MTNFVPAARAVAVLTFVIIGDERAVHTHSLTIVKALAGYRERFLLVFSILQENQRTAQRPGFKGT